MPVAMEDEVSGARQETESQHSEITLSGPVDVHSLPGDILIRIFLNLRPALEPLCLRNGLFENYPLDWGICEDAAARDESTTLSAPTRSLLRDPFYHLLAVTHVCQHWRNVARGCPRLWTRIALDKGISWISLLLELSKDAPLIVRASGRSKAAFRLLSPHVGRIQYMTMVDLPRSPSGQTGSDSFVKWEELTRCSSSFPMLRDAYLTYASIPEQDNRDIECTNLLRLHTVGVDFRSIRLFAAQATQLKHLDISRCDFDVVQLKAFLTTTMGHTLETFRLENPLPKNLNRTDTSAAQRLFLPNLRFLRLNLPIADFNGILRYICVGPRTRLSLECVPNNTTEYCWLASSLRVRRMKDGKPTPAPIDATTLTIAVAFPEPCFRQNTRFQSARLSTYIQMKCGLLNFTLRGYYKYCTKAFEGIGSIIGQAKRINLRPYRDPWRRSFPDNVFDLEDLFAFSQGHLPELETLCLSDFKEYTLKQVITALQPGKSMSGLEDPGRTFAPKLRTLIIENPRLGCSKLRDLLYRDLPRLSSDKEESTCLIDTLIPVLKSRKLRGMALHTLVLDNIHWIDGIDLQKIRGLVSKVKVLFKDGSGAAGLSRGRRMSSPSAIAPIRKRGSKDRKWRFIEVLKGSQRKARLGGAKLRA